MKKGISLIELLAVIAILLTLLAVTTPVFARSTQKADEANCIGNLHLAWVALTLYRNDNEPAATSGSMADMKLGFNYVSGKQPYPWNCQGPLTTAKIVQNTAYTTFVEPSGDIVHPTFPDYTAAYGDEIVALVDVAHNDLQTLEYYRPKYYGIGVRLSGSLIRRRAPAHIWLDLLKPRWWHDDFDAKVKH